MYTSLRRILFLIAIVIFPAFGLSQTTVLTENFDAGGLPAGWTRAGSTNCNLGYNIWLNTSELTSSGSNWCGTGCTTGKGGVGRCMFFYDWSTTGVNGNYLQTPANDLSPYTSSSLTFYYYNSGETDVFNVYAKQGAGGYSLVGGPYSTGGAAWTLVTINMSAWTGAGYNQVYIKLEGTGVCGSNNIGIDDVLLTGTASSSGCTNFSAFGTAAAPTSGCASIAYTWAGEYNTFTTVAASTSYQSTSSVSTDYITIRKGTSGGTLIAAGTTPLNWTSTGADTYYQHINTSSSCGTQNADRTSSLCISTCTTPGTPASATGTSTGQTTANASWTAGSAGSATVTYYWVVGTSSSVTYGGAGVAAQGTTTSTSASVTGLTCNTAYYLRVYAYTSCNATSSGYRTSTSTFTTSACTGCPNNTWSGNFGTDWGTAGNWSLGVVPDNTHTAIIPNVINDPIISVATSVCSITIQTGGVLQTNAGITISGTFAINSGGYYIHNNLDAPQTTIFAGTENFHASSTFEVRNWQGGTTFGSTDHPYLHNGSLVATDPMHNTPYGHLVINWWKSSFPCYQWEWHGLMTLSTNPRIATSLTILATGCNDIHMTEDGGAGQTHTLPNVTVTGGRLVFKGQEDSPVEGSSTLNINGNLTINGGNFTIEEDGETSSSYVNVVQVNGNFTMSSGGLQFYLSGASSSNISVNELRMTGNMNISGGTIEQFDPSTSVMQSIVFNGSGTQTYTESGAFVCRNFNYYVPSGKTLQLNSNMLIPLTNSTTTYPTLHITGTLIANSYQIYPSPYYFDALINNGVKIYAGGRLKTTNVNGFYTVGSSLTTINDAAVASVAARTVVIDPLGYVEYNSTTSAQAITNSVVKTENAGAVSPSRSYGILDIFNTTAGGSALTMAGDVTTDQLRLRDGVVNTGVNTMEVLNTTPGAAGSIQDHTMASYINTGPSGKLRRRVANSGYPLSYDFPVGNGNTNSYQLMNINVLNNTANHLDVIFDNPSDYLGTGLPLTDPQFFNVYGNILNNGGTNATTGHASYGGVWTVTPNVGSTDYDMTLYGRNHNNQGLHHTIIKRTNPAQPWDIHGTWGSTTNTTPITCNRINFSGFSQFAIGVSPFPMPVSLLNFNANCINNNVLLTWSTASETNNNYFTISKSTDASNYVTLGKIQGAGNSSIVNKYSFTDSDPVTNDTYYQLSQTDYNGMSETFSPVKISCDDHTGFTFDIYGNVIGDGNINISISGANDQDVLVVLTDVLGREIYSKLIMNEQGNYLISINPDKQLAVGLYFITASSNNTYISKKIVVK